MTRDVGYINVFNDFKGFGFIRRVKGKDVYFSIDDFDVEMDIESVSIGLKVDFLVEKTTKGPKALDIKILPLV
ncbi:cold shock domain family protein [Vibrio ichthyoenteri ATCC 700023]|uniref:Cold shock domain family protein n=1 Tax=Vibrio ichthyoenteri ATCC 700023 TaxID=870968 RepID=F9RWE3_9VIBR|nr:retron Se72 family effector protein [Vibrio ichthyoenteri]EGU49396.1 cold shock domain family protein [Vibrio ichthyoenteri ATCC 700023]